MTNDLPWSFKATAAYVPAAPPPTMAKSRVMTSCAEKEDGLKLFAEGAAKAERAKQRLPNGVDGFIMNEGKSISELWQLKM
jgi:hypothetical protein